MHPRSSRTAVNFRRHPGSDVTDLPENAVRAGDYIELFGKNVLVDDAAKAAGTIGYEMLTSIGLRHERKYEMDEE